MVNRETPTETLLPDSVSSWGGPIYADIPYIPELEVNAARYRYVSQGFEREIQTDEAIDSLGSDGFSFCSGFVMQDSVSKAVTLAHLEPGSNAIFNYLDKAPKDSPRKVTLFYGSLSARHTDLHRLFAQNYFGPMEYKTAHFESGNNAWGMVFNRISNQVKVFTKDSSQALITYTLL